MNKHVDIPAGFVWHPVHFCSLGFGSGLMKKAPGTWGTLLGLIIFVGLEKLMPPVGWQSQFLFVSVSFLVGIWFCGVTADALNTHDHGAIVWDEFVGIWMTLLIVPMTWFYVGMAFALFRLFDILKPWPIGWIDKRVSGGFGIMLDDVLAAGYAMLCLAVMQYAIVEYGV